jgi:hypothetical protein
MRMLNSLHGDQMVTALEFEHGQVGGLVISLVVPCSGVQRNKRTTLDLSLLSRIRFVGRTVGVG